MPKRTRTGRSIKSWQSGVSKGMMRRRVLSKPRRSLAMRKSTVRVQGVHTFSRRAAPIDEEMNGLYLARNYAYQFDMLQQSSEFSELFDNYKITMIELRIQLLNVPSATTVLNGQGTGLPFNPTNWYPKVWYVIDHDGGSTETLGTMRERQGVRCRILQPNKDIVIRFRPKVNTLTYKTATTQGYAPKSIKLDMADASVPHYGVNMVFDSNGLDPSDSYPFKFRIERKFFFQCMGVR